MSNEASNTQPERAFMVDELATRYRVSPSTIWRYITLEKIRVIRIGGRTVVPPAEVVRIDEQGLPTVSRAEERAFLAARRGAAA